MGGDIIRGVGTESGIFMTVVGVSENNGKSGAEKRIGDAQTAIGVAGIALGVAHVLPGLGQALSGVSVGLDLINLSYELWKCHLGE